MYILSFFCNFLPLKLKKKIGMYLIFLNVRNEKEPKNVPSEKRNDSRFSSLSQKRNDSRSKFQRNEESFLGTRSRSWNGPNSDMITPQKFNRRNGQNLYRIFYSEKEFSLLPCVQERGSQMSLEDLALQILLSRKMVEYAASSRAKIYHFKYL